MPAASLSQKRLFSMVRGYQAGKLKNPPAKIKEVAKHVTSEQASHFSKTNTMNLPEHVKKADCGKPHCDETEDMNLIKKVVKPTALKPTALKHMDKQAFQRGFFKAALDTGLTPLQAANLIKESNFDLKGIENYITDPANSKMVDTVAGAGIGGLGGAAVAGHGHKGEGALIGAGLGGGAGYFGGDLLKQLLAKQQPNPTPNPTQVGQGLGNGTIQAPEIPTQFNQNVSLEQGLPPTSPLELNSLLNQSSGSGASQVPAQQ